MKRYPLLTALCSCALLYAPPLHAQSNRIIAPIDSNQLVELPQSTPSASQTYSDRGAVDPSAIIQPIILFKSSIQQKNSLIQFLADQQNPASLNYRRWLNPFEFADRFGLSATDVAAIARWLELRGFTVTYSANARNWIAFRGTAAQISALFKTPIHAFLADGHTHFANTANVMVPAALADVIEAVRGLDDFHPKPSAHVLHSLRPDLTTAPGSHYLAPGDVAAIYDFSPLFTGGIDGAGQSIVVAGQTGIYLSDIASFRSTFGLPAAAPRTILYGSDPGISPEDLIEADLDLEWSGAMAPNAAVIYVYSSDVFNSVLYAVDQWPVLAPVISLSYGGCEQANRSLLNALRSTAQQANAAGITWVASSGDTGAAACDSQSSSRASGGLAVNVPASIPEVTAVGGSEFNENGGAYWNSSNGSNLSSALRYIPEIAWNDTTEVGVLNSSGGGVSDYYPTPVWQAGPGFPNDGFRDVPDIAFSSSGYHDPYVFCTNGECVNGELGTVGGTSVATPIFAGVLALLNQYLSSNGSILHPGLGNVNPTLYRLAQSTPFAFHDIASGSNIVPCTPGSPGCSTGSYGYNAAVGYDHVTGLGSIDAYNLIVSWDAPVAFAQPPAVLTSAASAISSAGVALNGSVNPNGADTQSWFLYSPDSSMAGSISTAPIDTGSGIAAIPVTANLSGLTPNTPYFFQCYASNSSGASHGGVLSFTTAAGSDASLNLIASPAGGGVLQPASGQSFPVGSSVPVNAVANNGWTFAGWSGPVADPHSPSTAILLNASQSITAGFIPQQFADVPPANAFFDSVNLLSTKSITSGCGPASYCPADPVTRAQMAIFIVRSVYGGDTFTVNQQTPYFADVQPGSFGYQWIQKMYELGITTGCSAGNFCPQASVSRAEMAAFIIRMRYAGDPFTAPSNPAFTDVPPGSAFFPYVQRMAADAITSGCTPALYCPDDVVTRGQMAAFIMRGGFNWLLPAGAPVIVSANPGQLNCCGPVTVWVTGAGTHFAQGLTTLVSPPGVTSSNLTVLTPTSFSVVLEGSISQPEPIYVRTAAEEAVLPNVLLPAQ